MRYTYCSGRWFPCEPATKGIPADGVPYCRPDRYGRGEFLVTNRDGSQRITKGWRDWRSHCKAHGLVEISPNDKTLRENRAHKIAKEKLDAALPKALDSAIRKVKDRPYFDKRVLGGSRLSSSEIKEDIRRQARRRAA